VISCRVLWPELDRAPDLSHTALELATAIASRFAIDGDLLRLESYHRGHIHDTFVSEWREPYGIRRYLHQRMNDRVFRDIESLMHNVAVVTRHLERRQMRDSAGPAFHTLQLVAPRGGGAYLDDPSGRWRTYRFIENTETFDLCRDPVQAHDAARAFGRFQAQLADLDATTLRETIVDFFSSPHRLRQFDAACAAASAERQLAAAKEIEFVHSRRAEFAVIEARQKAGAMPIRIVHGDTKLNNVLFDKGSGRAVAIVDLDTCMPAWSLYDFGDLVRFTAATAAEDERDLSRVSVDLEVYRALVDGYLESTRGFLTDEEIELMPFAARLVTLTVGSRFLTDFLNGDVYFKIDPARPQHNLERARVQFALVAAMEARGDAMRVMR
jgi:Phosphotransferase enzyme family